MRDIDPFARKLIEQLYIEAMVLADEARAYFEREQDVDEQLLSPALRISLSCESLRVTTRLMHAIAWLLNQKAYLAGELSVHQLAGHGRALGLAPDSDPAALALLPERAQTLVHDSEQLFDRLVRLEGALARERENAEAAAAHERPAVHDLQRRLSAAMALADAPPG